jgi:hypothetical protein
MITFFVIITWLLLGLAIAALFAISSHDLKYRRNVGRLYRLYRNEPFGDPLLGSTLTLKRPSR